MSRRELAGVTLAAVLLTVYFTWPMAPRLGSVGRLEPGDGPFSVWNIAWVAHAIISADAAVYDANIFYPHEKTLTFSEPNIGAGLLAVPAYLLTRNPYAAHNSAVLIGLSLSVLGMYLLARRLTGSREAAFVAGIVFAFCPFLFARTAHIQLMMTALLPFTLLAFHGLADRPSVRRAVVLGVTLGVQALFCSYYGVLAGLLVGLGTLVFAAAAGTWRQPRWWGLAVLAAVVSGLTVLPFFLPYLDLQRDTGFGRTLAESYRYSADWRAYFASSALAHRWMLGLIGRWNEVLFPGFTAVVFGVAGMVLALTSGRRTAADTPRWTGPVTAFYLLMFVLALWSSFGPAAGLYTVLYETVPIFSLLRAPARFGLAVTLALSVFTAFAVAVLLRRFQPSRRRWAAGVIALLAVAELTTPIPFQRARDVPRAYKLLAQAERGPVAEFPFYHEPHDRYRHTIYLLGSTAHWQPLINGYSDFIPRDFSEGAALLASFPDRAGLDWLHRRGARYIVFHLGLYDGPTWHAVQQRLETFASELSPRFVHGPVHVYELVAPARSAP